MTQTIALIPCRAGSKRIPRKNWLTVGPLRLYEHAMDAAPAESAVVVSSDDMVSGELDWAPPVRGARRRYLHQRDGADDHETTDEWLEQVIPWVCGNVGVNNDAVFVVLQPTSPLRTRAQVTAALIHMRDLGADSLLSFGPSGASNGAIYACTLRSWERHGTLTAGRIAVCGMDRESSIDIDTPDDLERAREAWARRHGT